MRTFLFTSLLLLAAPLLADDGTPRKVAQATKPMPKAAAQQPLVEAAEEDVIEFVREHHPELGELLGQLKESRPKEYQKAIRDLSRVRERLRAMKTNDDERYQLELSMWKTETRIQLLAARLQMQDKDSAEARDQLREALSEQIDIRLALLKHERQMAKERLAKLDAQIERLDKERSQTIDKQLQTLTKAPPKPAEKPVKKPAEKPTPEKKPAKKP
jgi:hypothetical protein